MQVEHTPDLGDRANPWALSGPMNRTEHATAPALDATALTMQPEQSTPARTCPRTWGLTAVREAHDLLLEAIGHSWCILGASAVMALVWFHHRGGLAPSFTLSDGTRVQVLRWEYGQRHSFAVDPLHLRQIQQVFQSFTLASVRPGLLDV